MSADRRLDVEAGLSGASNDAETRPVEWSPHAEAHDPGAGRPPDLFDAAQKKLDSKLPKLR